MAARVLGVPPDADPKTIKKAYLKLAWRWHPDVNPDHPDAAENFAKIQKAYELLSRHEASAETHQSGSSEPHKTVRWMRVHLKMEKKRKQKAEAILSSRLRIIRGGGLPALKVMYVISLSALLLLPLTFILALYESFRYPWPDRAGLLFLCVLGWLMPGLFLAFFLVHMRFIWTAKNY